MTMASAATGLAATGSDVAPWLIGAGVVIVLGAVALIIGQVVRSRRAAAGEADAAASAAGAAAARELAEGADGDVDGDPISPDEPR